MNNSMDAAKTLNSKLDKQKATLSLWMTIFTMGWLMFCGSSSLFAAGTPAGTVISTRSSAWYQTQSGARVDTVHSNTISVIVRQIAAINVTPIYNRAEVGSGAVVDYPLQMTNSGNGLDSFRLLTQSSQGWDFKLYPVQRSGSETLGPDTTAGNLSMTDSLMADSSLMMIARIVVPSSDQVNAKTDSAILTIRSQFDSLKASFAVLFTSAKCAILQPILSVDNPIITSVRRATYTLALTNIGLDSASNIIIRTKLDPRIVFLSATQGGQLVGADSIIWTLEKGMQAGTSKDLSFTVEVKSGLPYNAVIPATMQIDYRDGLNFRQKQSNTVNIGVAYSYSVAITPKAFTVSREPKDSIIHTVFLKNNGNNVDTIQLAYASTQSLPWRFFEDRNRDGIFNQNDPEIMMSGQLIRSVVDSVSSGDSLQVFAYMQTPMVQYDSTIDQSIFMINSKGDLTAADTAHATTTIRRYNVAVSITLDPISGDAPGDSVMVTVNYRNTGGSVVDTFEVITPIPETSTFLLHSALVNGVAKEDKDILGTDAQGNPIVRIQVGALGKNQSGRITFKIKIR